MVYLEWMPDNGDDLTVSLAWHDDYCGCKDSENVGWMVSSGRGTSNDLFDEMFDYFESNRVVKLKRVNKELNRIYKKHRKANKNATSSS